MIVSMKKVTLLCLTADQDRTLDRLRDLGVLHVTHVREPKSEDVDATNRTLEQARDALTALDVEAQSLKARTRKRTAARAAGNARPLSQTNAEVHEIIAHLNSLTRLQKEFAERIAALREEKKIMAPYGHFDPEQIEKLARRGIRVKLYSVGGKHLPSPPENACIFPLSHDPLNHYFAVIGREGDFTCTGCEFVPHHRPLSLVEEDLTQAEADLEHVHRQIQGLEACRPAIEAYIREREWEQEFLGIRAGMGDADHVAYLQGFCPVDILPALQDEARRRGWGLLMEDPAPEERVPTLLRNPRWVRPIKSLLDMMDVMPGYREVDINWIFLIAFSLFFAMLVGDAGYGLIFLGLTAILRRKFKTAPAAPFHLLYILSLATVGWGILSGNVFGTTPGLIRGLTLGWLTEENNFMELCFLIGAVHLSIAHGWNAVRMMNSTRALAELGWICLTWAMFLGARNLVLNYELPAAFRYLLLAGVILIPLFMVPLRRLKHDWQNFCTLPFDMINDFVDIVSYVRLFAVGSASLAVATAFNQMAIGNGIDSVWAGLGAALVLFLGHALNIVLALMSVLVHGVRLNTLEFSSHLGLEWSGFKYEPFAKGERK